MPSLTPALTHLLIGFQQSVHRSDRAQILLVLVQESGKNRGRRQVDELGSVERFQNLVSLLLAQGSGRSGAGCSLDRPLHRNTQPPIERRARNTQIPTSFGSTDHRRQFRNRSHQSFPLLLSASSVFIDSKIVKTFFWTEITVSACSRRRRSFVFSRSSCSM